jgi:hypothetical protein
MHKSSLQPVHKNGPLFESTHFKDTKDPSICFDGTTWHIFGSGGNTYSEEWQLLHATAPTIEGPWEEHPPLVLIGLTGLHVAAPSVIFDERDRLFHMAVQEDFMSAGGGIEYLVSSDGNTFSRMGKILAHEGISESGLYDPQFSCIGDEKYLVYSGIPAASRHTYHTLQPDVYLAKSTTGLWSGPWERLGKILDHDDIDWHHNRREHPDYEWGIEGPQVIALPNGKFLLNASCFIEEGRRGTRQRVFFALADTILGPYKSLGPVLSSRDQEWESGENGHATVTIWNNMLYIFFQARSQKVEDPKEANDWRYGIATFSLQDLYLP